MSALLHAHRRQIEYELPSVLYRTDHRDQWFKTHPSKPPSDQGQIKEFDKAQRGKNPAFAFSRPRSATPTIPITLHHPIFGQFYDDCEQYEPSPEDHAFERHFSELMSRFYDKEGQRLNAAREAMGAYGLHFNVSNIGSYQTDGDVRVGDFPVAIVEGKLEIGSGSGAEPLFQAAWYYVESVRLMMKTRKLSKFPCLIMYIAGTCYQNPHTQIMY